MYTIQQIGNIDEGIDGRDEYVIVKRIDGEDATVEDVHEWVLNLVYRDCQHAGGYYCKTVYVVKQQYSDNEFICTICHRYDV